MGNETNPPQNLQKKRKRLLIIAGSVTALSIIAGVISYRWNLSKYHRGEYMELLSFMPLAEPAVWSETTRPQRYTRVKEHLDKSFIQARVPNRSPRFLVFRTRYSLGTCKDGISVRNESGLMNQSPDLLNDATQSSGWTYLKPASFALFEGGSKSPFVLDSKNNFYQDTRYYNTGLVRWKFSATARFSQRDAPGIVVFVDKKRIISTTLYYQSFRTYEFQTFLRRGNHTVSIQFKNKLSKESDRSVLLASISAEYIGSLLVTSDSASGIDVSYCTPDPVKPFSRRAEVNGYVQDSLQFPRFSRMGFRLYLPDASRISFATTTIPVDSAHPPNVNLTLYVKPWLSKKRKIFNYTVPGKPEWREHQIDLTEFAKKPLILEFESNAEGKFFGDGGMLALSNPTISSVGKTPQKTVQHIFIITADALRASHLGCYGYTKPTSPIIDSFAKDSVLFQNAISQAPATLSSTASLFTSVYPSSHKTDVNNSRLASSFQTLPKMIRATGYLTAGFVKNEFLNPPHGLTDGFLWYLYDKFGTPSENRIPPALKWIEDRRDSPTFVFFHLLHPHSPYIPPPEIASLFHVEQSALASSNDKLREMDFKNVLLSPAEREQLVTLYDAEIRHLDGLFGQFIDHLKSLNIYDQSLIIFLSDHGEAFQEHQRWGHGSTLYQEMIHVPLIVKFPLKFQMKGKVVTSYVQTMDLMPTILELLSLPRPESLQGKSLLPVIKGQAAERPVFSEGLKYNMLAIISRGYKYIYFGYSQKEEIYNLRTDSGEKSEFSRTNPELLQMFRKERSSFFHRAMEWRAKYIGKDSGEHIVLDENQTEELRALGYIR